MCAAASRCRAGDWHRKRHLALTRWLGRRQTFGIASVRQNSAVVGTSTSVMTAKFGSQHLNVPAVR